jgi:site-specific DNA-methyltransferase (cytosine-N4-specific)
MLNYKLMGPDLKLTSVGQELLAMKDDADALYKRFAAHILTECFGLDVLKAVKNLQARGVEPKKDTLSAEMKSLGFAMPRATTKPLLVLNWLRKAKVLAPKGYAIDDGVVARILGTQDTIIEDLVCLSQPERLFLRALGKSAGDCEWANVSDIMTYAEGLYHFKFPEDRWQSSLLKPLEKKGWIELVRGTSGRGAKSGRVRGTEKFRGDFLKRLLEENAEIIPAEVRAAANKPLADILVDMKSEDTHKKGIALEHLAVRLAQFLDLTPKQWRLRSAKTGGAEVDLVVEGARLMFSRWQVQCKNTKAVHLSDLAKEVGLAVMLKSQIIMIVTTGRVPNSVRYHARVVNQSTALQILLIDGETLSHVAERGPVRLIDFLNTQASTVMQQKEGQLLMVDDEWGATEQ